MINSLRLGCAYVIGLSAFLTVVDLFATQAILPTLTKAYGVSPAAMGLAVNASTIGMAIAGLLVGLFSRSLARKTVKKRGLLPPPTFLPAVPALSGAIQQDETKGEPNPFAMIGSAGRWGPCNPHYSAGLSKPKQRGISIRRETSPCWTEARYLFHRGSPLGGNSCSCETSADSAVGMGFDALAIWTGGSGRR
jgi:hypothetical protein